MLSSSVTSASSLVLPPTRHALVVGLLLGEVLGLLLLLREEGAQPAQRIARDHQAGGDDRLPACHEPIAAALLVLVAPRLEDVVLALEGQSERHERHVEDGGLDLLGVLLDDGEGLVDAGQAVAGELVGLGDVGLDVAVGTLGVGQDGRDDGLVAVVGEVE